MKHDEKWLEEHDEYLDDHEVYAKAYAEHLVHDFLDEREGLKKYIAELEAHINEREGSGFGTK